MLVRQRWAFDTEIDTRTEMNRPAELPSNQRKQRTVDLFGDVLFSVSTIAR